MSVDKFGRHANTIKLRKETKRSLHEDIGIGLTPDGHVDVENKKICNLGNPTGSNDAVPFHVIQERCVLFEDNGVFEDDFIIDARDHKIIRVKEPAFAKDVANKSYVDRKSIQRDENNNLMIGNCRITQVNQPVYKTDAVNLEYVRNNSLFIQDNSFSAKGKRLTNVADGNNDVDAVTMRQMYDFKRDEKSELHKIVKILQRRIDKIITYIYKLHAHTARTSLGVEESQLKARDNTETQNLIKEIDRHIVSDDWRTLF